MTVLLRAALVIGVLSYFAMLRTGADPAAEARKLAGAVPSAGAGFASASTASRSSAARRPQWNAARFIGTASPFSAIACSIADADNGNAPS